MIKTKIQFNYEFFRSNRGILHLLTLILGLIVLAVGWHSYFKSEWTSVYSDMKSLLNGTTISVPENGGNIAETRFKTLHLPNLLKEQIFLGISLATFCVSLIFYSVYLLGLQNRHQSSVALWSVLYNLMGATALIVVGGLLMLSAAKIDEFSTNLRRVSDILEQIDNIQLYGEKISAGVICVINGVISAMIAALSRTEARPKKKVRLFRKNTENAA